MISTPKMFLAAFETLQHMLDFRSSVSCIDEEEAIMPFIRQNMITRLFVHCWFAKIMCYCIR